MYIYKIDNSEELKQGGFDFPIYGEYHYIKIGTTTVSQLKKAKILPDKVYRGLGQNKPDGLILKGKNDVVALVEYKKDGIDTKEKAREVLTDWYFELAKVLNCNVLCSSDGNNTYWFHVLKGDSLIGEEGKEFRKNFNVKDITKNKFSDEDKKEWETIFQQFEGLIYDSKMTPSPVLNPQELARSVWQMIWISTGKEPEKCLYNVVEIFIFKFLSDLGILTGDNTFNHVYELSQQNKTNSLKFYANMVRPQIRTMFPISLTDGTTIINGTIFINEEGKANLNQATLFAKVLEKFTDFEEKQGSFQKIDKQFKTRLYENFLRQSARVKSLGQYFTPRNVVTAMVKMANPDSLRGDEKICDPFCGVGGFLLELLNEAETLKKQFEPSNGKITPKTEIIGYDKGSDEKEDERTIILAKANMLIYFSDLISKYKDSMIEFSKKVFNQVFHLVKTNLGTLGIDSHKEYFDLILTNPPYVTSGVSTIKKEIEEKGLKSMYPSNGGGLEGLAIEWIINALKPNGKAYIIVPDGILNRQNDKRLRDRILRDCIVNAIISLPTRTFFATPKKTFILVITKKEDNTKIQNTPVFTYLVSEIGETRDAKRFDIPENDLVDMVTLFKQFSVTPKEFESDNIRCKIQTISRLKESHWLIDKDWNEEEKIEMGIAEETTEMTEKEFYEMISEIGNLLSEFSKEVHNGV